MAAFAFRSRIKCEDLSARSRSLGWSAMGGNDHSTQTMPITTTKGGFLFVFKEIGLGLFPEVMFVKCVPDEFVGYFYQTG